MPSASSGRAISCASHFAANRVDIAKLVRPTLFVAEQTPVFKLIDLFRRQGVRIAVVVDEYGGTEGIVTATDVLEGIAGALPDRDEEEGPVSFNAPTDPGSSTG